MTFTLAPASPLNFQDFTANSKVMVTAFGMELNAGVETYKVLLQGSPTSSATACQYTPATGVTAFIKSMHLYNSDTIDHQIRAYLGGSTAAAAITSVTWIPAGGMAVWGEHGWNVYNASGQRLMAIAGLLIPYNGAATSTRLSYNYDTNTGSGPSSGNFRLSTNTPHSVADVQTLYLANLDNGSVDRSLFLAQLQAAVNRQDLIVTIMQSDTDMEALRYRITSITNNTTYWTLQLVALRVSSTLPALSTSCKIQFDCEGNHAQIHPPAMGGVMCGYPNFSISNMQTLTAVNASTSYAVPFYVDHAIRVSNISAILGATGSTSLNVRFAIYRMRYVKGGSPALGAKLYDQPITNFLTGTLGLRQIAPALILPPGYYWCLMCMPAFSGSPTLTKMFGLYPSSMNFNGSQGSPTITAQWAITGTDYVAAGAAPAEGVTMNSVTASAINATFSLTCGFFHWLEWQPL